MRPVLVAFAVLFGLGGCGDEGHRATPRPPPNARPFGLKGLGSFTVTCPARGRYVIDFRDDPERATARITVVVGGRVARRVTRNPGARLVVPVRAAGGIAASPTIEWRVVAVTEPETLQGLARMRVESGGGGSRCDYARLDTSVASQRHAGP